MPSENVICLHNSLPGHDKIYVCRVDYVGGTKPFRVVAAWGRANKPKVQAEQTKDEFARISDAVGLMSRLVNEKVQGGYENVESVEYRGNLSKATILGKVDMTRCYSDTMSIPVSAFKPQALAPASKPKQDQAPKATLGRASRMIQCGD